MPCKYLCLTDARLTLHNGAGAIRDARSRHWIYTIDTPLLVRAVFPYTANLDVPDELSFKKDEVLGVTERVPGWWNAGKSNGEIGIVPSP